MKPQTRSRLIALLSLGIFALAVGVLSNAFANLAWADVRAYFTALSPWRVAAALGFAAASYYFLTWYDTLAVRFVSGRKFAWRQVAPTSFTAYAVGHNVGISTLSGGAIRLRDYTRMGLSGAQVAGVVTLCIFALGLGSNLLIEYALFFHTEEAARVLHISPATARLAGVAAMACLLGYLWITARKRGAAFRLGGSTIPAPPLGFSMRQIAVALADLCCSAAAFYCLLPLEGLGYPAFLGFYALAMVAGMLSNVPGGLGVFESVLLLTVPEAAPAQLAGAALAFRAVYFLLPFVLALALMGLRELLRWRQRRPQAVT